MRQSVIFVGHCVRHKRHQNPSWHAVATIRSRRTWLHMGATNSSDGGHERQTVEIEELFELSTVLAQLSFQMCSGSSLQQRSVPDVSTWSSKRVSS